MPEEDLEDRLRRVPLRALPASWRTEILAEARGQQPAAGPSARWLDWRRWFDPSPAAWAGLAAAWCLIATLHFATPSPVALQVKPAPAAPSPQIRQMLHEQRSLLAELAGLAPETLDAPLDSGWARPRSKFQNGQAAA